MRQVENGEMYRAGLPTLGARLLEAAGSVRRGSVVADIGCDHGKLAVWLALTGAAKRVIAADARPMPLAKAKALVQQTGCADKVECRLGDGLAVLQPGEAEDIVIAGLSGETIAEILARAGWLRDGALRLVLVPATRADVLRGWLYRQGFGLLREVPVEEAGRCYTVMTASYTGEAQEPEPLMQELGLLAGQKCPVVEKIIKTRLVYLNDRHKAPMSDEEAGALDRLIREVEACLE